MRSTARKIRSCSSRKRVERQVHDSDDQKRDAEDDTVAAERLRYRERGDEHPRHRDQQRPEHPVVPGVEAVRQPRIRRPRPPKHSQDQEPLTDSVPGRVVQEHERHLREREDEDEIEEQLDRGDPMLDLERLLAHERRLTITRHPGQPLIAA